MDSGRPIQFLCEDHYQQTQVCILYILQYLQLSIPIILKFQIQTLILLPSVTAAEQPTPGWTRNSNHYFYSLKSSLSWKYISISLRIIIVGCSKSWNLYSNTQKDYVQGDGSHFLDKLVHPVCLKVGQTCSTGRKLYILYLPCLYVQYTCWINSKVSLQLLLQNCKGQRWKE